MTAIILGLLGYVALLLYAVHAGERGRRVLHVVSSSVIILAVVGGVVVLAIDPLWLLPVGSVIVVFLPLWVITRPARAFPEEAGLQTAEPSAKGKTGLLPFLAGYLWGRRRRG